MTGWILLTAAAAAAAVCLAVSAYEKNCLAATEYSVCTGKLSPEFDWLKLVFLTDLHNKEFGEGNARLLEKIDGIAPDMILIGGDMIVAKGQSDCPLDTVIGLVSALAKKYPVYYGYGNHELRLKELPVYREHYQRFLAAMRECGVRILDDAGVTFHGSGGNLTVTGLTLTKESYPKFRRKAIPPEYVEKKAGPAVEGGLNILMAHNPLFQEEYAEWGADVTLSGHYHGGTIILPLLGGVMSPDCHLFPKLYRGRYETRGKAMIVSGGLGTHSVNIRLGNKPEVVVLRLKRVERDSLSVSG